MRALRARSANKCTVNTNLVDIIAADTQEGFASRTTLDLCRFFRRQPGPLLAAHWARRSNGKLPPWRFAASPSALSTILCKTFSVDFLPFQWYLVRAAN
jgi:hypothetical protein